MVDLELSATAGPDYDEEDESVLATFAPGRATSWAGTFGLGVPGATTQLQALPITAESNERGSNAVTVTRPAANAVTAGWMDVQVIKHR